MPESIGHGSTHTDRLHHHRARVRQSRLALDQAAVTAAAGDYDPGREPNNATGPPRAEDRGKHGNN